MHAIEFQATIKDGKIKIPKSYQAQLAKRVRVIVLSEEKSVTSENSATPLPKKQPLTAESLLRSGLVDFWADRNDITDSLAFARQLRHQAERRSENPHVTT